MFSLLARKHGAVEVWMNSQVEPYCISRDNSVRKIVESAGGNVFAFDDATLLHPGSVVNQSGEQYKVYTPFRNQAMKQITDADYIARTPEKLKANEFVPEGFRTFQYVQNGVQGILKGGRKEGLRMLKEFYSDGMNEYKARRDFPATKGTSMLSPHLHFGSVSIRETFRAALRKKKNCTDSDETAGVDAWINELMWREFYYHITFCNPQLTHSSFRKEFDKVKWEYDEDRFSAWCEGMTGYPIVDAGMRQLKAEGWMHNRIRMVTAMFLTKDLLTDWRLGEKHFADHLIDLDFSSNNGGWQWSASTGVDAQPYFRIFNPYLQSKKFDPDGNYIRKYVSELKNVPSEFIHEPQLLNEKQQDQFGVKIGSNYPFPIVDHMKAKEEAIRRFSIASGKNII